MNGCTLPPAFADKSEGGDVGVSGMWVCGGCGGIGVGMVGWCGVVWGDGGAEAEDVIAWWERWLWIGVGLKAEVCTFWPTLRWRHPMTTLVG